VWMWTSAHKTADLSIEFCSILNEALRVDVGNAAANSAHASIEAEVESPMLQPAVLLTCMLQRFLNASRRISNNKALEHEAWPDGDGVNSTVKDTTFRGCGLPSAHFGFFKALAGTKQYYRVPHPLASSFTQRKARDFADLQQGRTDPYDNTEDMPKVLFIIQLDPSGCLQGIPRGADAGQGRERVPLLSLLGLPGHLGQERARRRRHRLGPRLRDHDLGVP